MKKILVTWASWMLATDFQKYAADYFDITAFDKTQLDITNIWDVQKKIIEIRPDCVLNCAAYTHVDEAEDAWREICHEINTLWIQNLARVTAQENTYLITLSTDYVFDGKKSSGYLETDICHPINQYGQSKYEGECLALWANSHTIIVRTSWLYGGGKEHKNFVNTILKLSETKKKITIVNDQFGCPTSCADLSKALIHVINDLEKYRGRVLHFSNKTLGEHVSWYDFAEEILKQVRKSTILLPCSYVEYLTKAKRPQYSQLINSSDIVLRNWREPLREYIREYFSS